MLWRGTYFQLSRKLDFQVIGVKLSSSIVFVLNFVFEYHNNYVEVYFIIQESEDRVCFKIEIHTNIAITSILLLNLFRRSLAISLMLIMILLWIFKYIRKKN